MRRFFARLTAALAAFRSAPAAQQADNDNAVSGDVNGTLVQAREIGDLTIDRSQRVERQAVVVSGVITHGANSVIHTGNGDLTINR
ncbi:hypothetical protein [Nocardiopsis sp. NPDC006938]|uniref:hypothetical protein n=1 Tax=Nocardiopsis sp. NPDC006938 TaxID=3364337 RepID=UPI00368D6403